MKASQNFILAIDQSTSGTKALLVDRQGNVTARSSIEHTQLYPRPGWVEHDPIEIYENVKVCIKQVLEQAGISSEDLVVITITNQRETAVMWDKTTGLPIYNAIVWQCQRTAETCKKLKDNGYENTVHSKTGLLLDPYFSATKFKWILDHVDEAQRLLNEDELLAGTIDSWLIWKLTGGAAHVSDYTNASRTSLFNIHTLQWDEEMSTLFGVPLQVLPNVTASDSIVGYTAEENIFSSPVPIAGIIGDSQGALFGHLCFEPGSVKATYGTGTSVLMNVGDTPMDGGEGLVTAIAWGAGGKVTYALEAIIRSSGDSVKWTRDNLGLFTTFDEMQHLIDELPSNEGVYLIPAFVGMGVPYWNPSAQAAITGMNRGTRKAHIVRAAIESIAYQVRDAVDFMQIRTMLPLLELRTDGGASSNSWLMQFQADILDRPVTRSNCPELSALGSAYFGGLAVGFWRELDQIALNKDLYETFQPSMSESTRNSYYAGWKNAIRTVVQQSTHTEISS